MDGLAADLVNEAPQQTVCDASVSPHGAGESTLKQCTSAAFEDSAVRSFDNSIRLWSMKGADVVRPFELIDCGLELM